ncbi:hypothetical protein BRADI_5g23550v3 [Brachypodium distachyon]|uniref:pectinesterase n=1 Tax=Brachypodium distachyon TaxID=15368 RepID=I1J2F7_BRADI|nr:hypothetical protein BRADI_5g23550v3 [Brachypodium distachyon]
MANKAATASIIAAVGVVAVIGTIAAVTASKKAHDGSDGGSAMSTSIKLSALCSSTLYPTKCEKSLSPVVNETSDPEEVLKASLQVAMDEVAAAFARYAYVGKGATDGTVTKSAIGECKKLLDDAVGDLKDMAGLRADQVVSHVKDLRTWLSGVMTYIYTCADGFDKPELKEAMDKLLQNSTELSSNALAIVTRVGEFLKGQESAQKNGTSIGAGSRRLLGWPAIISDAETRRRRLLEISGKLDEIASVRDASRRLLVETMDEIDQMSHDGSRRLDNFVFGDHFSNLTDIPSQSKESDFVRRRLLSMSFDDASSKATDDSDRDAVRRRRRLLSAQLESIADMSAQLNRRLLAMDVPTGDDMAGKKRQRLSNSLVMINDAAAEAQAQLEEIDDNCGNDFTPPEEEERRALTSDVIGTIEDLDHKHHQRKMLTTDVVGTIDDLDHKHHHRRKLLTFPEWVPAQARRLLQIPGLQKPNAVVAADGSGNFKTITEAVNAAPKKSTARFVIYVKAGEYKEYVTIPKDVTNVFMFGDGPTKTRVVGDKSNKGGFATIATRTFSAEGNGFICKSMGFVNTAGPDGHQAVALHVQGDMSVFFNCRFEGYQDTLYVHANRQFFRNCEVLGTIDFIFGNSAALFQNCLMTVRKPMESQANMVTAHGRTDPNMPTGIVLQGCKIVPEQELFPARLTIASYLGRPWKEYSRTVVMESTIGDLIRPEGWSEWMGDLGLKTLYYAEYNNNGPGAGTSKRVAWPGYRVIGQAEATHFTAGVFIDGISWLQSTGTPNVMGFIK